MCAWFTVSDILIFNRGELPSSKRGINRYANENGWQQTDKARKADRKGGGMEYHISLLPPTLQARIEFQQNTNDAPEETAKCSMWQQYEKLSNRHKMICKKRLSILQEIEDKTDAGIAETAAVKLIASEHSISPSTIFGWKAQLNGVNRPDWLAALAPKYSNRQKSTTDVHPEAWEVLKSDYLRVEKPSFSSCYRRAEELANRNGWSPFPIARTLRRRLNHEVPREVQISKREGRDTLKTLYPAQRRTRKDLRAMQAVNMDGHKFDVFVKMKDGSVGRLYLIALQDLYSNKFVAWRLSHSENKETVRLVIGDMVEKYGIPEEIVLDNGRAFASKWITGGMKTRYRFKIRDEEPKGLVTSLGITAHWTEPYSGQSKPIERAFKDFCDNMAKHPFCSGAYTGNSPVNQPENYGKRAIDEDLFRDFIDTQIGLHNAQAGRNTEIAKGRSFDEAFMQSINDPTNIISWPTKQQKSLWLLTAEQVRAKRGDGVITFYENRYWSPALSGYAGKPVVVRFDPENLMAGIKVYDIADQFICDAPIVEDAGFFDQAAARKHNKNRRDYMRHVRGQADLHATMTADELARLYQDNKPVKEVPIRPSIPKVVTGNHKTNTAEQPVWDDEAENSFARGLRLVSENE